ncbi:MAG: thioredoxin [Candidatus Thermoplasmatota archaeon]|nr:thioredoxin [Candidatus Thermoplasmatota archaeon]
MSVQRLDDKNFEEFISQNAVAVVDFYADWCMPCRIMSPRIDELSEELKEVAFSKLNVDENSSIAQRFGIISIPTLIIFKNGSQVDEIVGTRSKDGVRETVSKYL